MPFTLDYLEQLKAAYPKGSKPASDYRIAQLLDVTPQTINAWRRERARMGDAVALKAAALLGLPPLAVIAELHLEKAKDPVELDFWKGLQSSIKKNRRTLPDSQNGNGTIGLQAPWSLA